MSELQQPGQAMSPGRRGRRGREPAAAAPPRAKESDGVRIQLPEGVDLDGPEPGERLARAVWRAGRIVREANERLRQARDELRTKIAEFNADRADRHRRELQDAVSDLATSGVSASDLRRLADLARENPAELARLLGGGA